MISLPYQARHVNPNAHPMPTWRARWYALSPLCAAAGHFGDAIRGRVSICPSGTCTPSAHPISRSGVRSNPANPAYWRGYPKSGVWGVEVFLVGWLVGSPGTPQRPNDVYTPLLHPTFGEAQQFRPHSLDSSHTTRALHAHYMRTPPQPNAFSALPIERHKRLLSLLLWQLLWSNRTMLRMEASPRLPMRTRSVCYVR